MNKRTFVFGDIHGCFKAFKQLLEQIDIQENDEIISLGDILDRGPDSYGLYHFFKQQKNAKLIIGNHERKHIRGILSYGQEIVKVQFKEEYDDLVQWLETQDYYYETEDAIIIHAFFEHDVPLKDQRKEVLSGSTAGTRYLEKKYGEGNYWSDFYKGTKPIIYGHHVVGEQPKLLNNTYGIDTGACHGGMLTAIELPGFKVHQIRVEKDHWADEMKKWQLPVLEAKPWHQMTFDQIETQIKKLRRKKDTVIQEYLDQKENWLFGYNEILEQVYAKIEEISAAILSEYGEKGFNLEASQHRYKEFLFKSKFNNLKANDLKRKFNTPDKLKGLFDDLFSVV